MLEQVALDLGLEFTQRAHERVVLRVRANMTNHVEASLRLVVTVATRVHGLPVAFVNGFVHVRVVYLWLSPCAETLRPIVTPCFRDCWVFSYLKEAQ